MPLALRQKPNPSPPWMRALSLAAAAGALAMVACSSTAPKPKSVAVPPPPVPVQTPGRSLMQGDPHVTAHDFFLRARQMENEGNEAVALGYFRIAYEYHPESRDLCFILVDRLRSAGMLDTALSFARRCMVLKGEPEADQYKTLGELLLRQKELLAAIDMYEKALALDDGDRDLLYTLATLYESLKETEKQAGVLGKLLQRLDYPQRLVEKQVALLRDLKRIQEVPHLWSEAWTRSKNALFGEHLAEWYEEEGQWDSLLAVTERLSREAGDPLQYQLYSARALALAGREDSSFAAYARLMKKHPEEREVLFPYAVFLFDKKRHAEAKPIFAKLTKLKPSHAPYQFFLGSSAWELGESALAASALKKAVDLEPRIPEYWSKLISVKLKRGEVGQSDSLLATLNSQDTADLAAHFLRGAVFTLLARRYEAIPGAAGKNSDIDTALTRRFRLGSVAAYGDVLRIDWRNRRGLFELGVALERLGRIDSAVKVLRTLVDLDTNDAVASNYLGYTLVEANRDLEWAGQLIERALRKDPGNGAYLDSRGWWQFRRGDHAKALADIQQALEKMPHDITVLEHYALILEKLGKDDDARRQWQAILKIEPHHALATLKVH